VVLPLSASRLAFVGTNSLTSPVRKTEARKCELDRYRLYDNEEAKNLDAGADDCSRADGRSVPALIFQVYVPHSARFTSTAPFFVGERFHSQTRESDYVDMNQACDDRRV
jgi:hypothetical protein